MKNQVRKVVLKGMDHYKVLMKEIIMMIPIVMDIVVRIVNVIMNVIVKDV